MSTEPAERMVPLRAANPSAQLLRLLQLASPALPVGGYSYSQGLEAAVHAGRVYDRDSAARWIGDLMSRFLARCEAPVLLLAARAGRAHDAPLISEVNDWYYASRETAASRAETRQMGWSLRKLSGELGWIEPGSAQFLAAIKAPVYPVVFGCLGAALGLDESAMLSGYLFAWLENQVIALQKLLPVGQSAGQSMLFELSAAIPEICAEASARAHLGLDAVETFIPQMGLLAARHETQYSRIFRT